MVVWISIGIAFLIIWAVVTVVSTAIICIGGKTTTGEKKFLRIMWTFSLCLVWDHFKSIRNGDGWSKPWKWKPHRTSRESIYRYNSSTQQYQKFEYEKWKDVKHVTGDPLNITFTDFTSEDKKFNPYEMFNNPCRPTKEEIALFEIEIGGDFSRIKSWVKAIVKGEKV